MFRAEEGAAPGVNSSDVVDRRLATVVELRDDLQSGKRYRRAKRDIEKSPTLGTLSEQVDGDLAGQVALARRIESRDNSTWRVLYPAVLTIAFGLLIGFVAATRDDDTALVLASLTILAGYGLEIERLFSRDRRVRAEHAVAQIVELIIMLDSDNVGWGLPATKKNVNSMLTLIGHTCSRYPLSLATGGKDERSVLSAWGVSIEADVISWKPLILEPTGRTGPALRAYIQNFLLLILKNDWSALPITKPPRVRETPSRLNRVRLLFTMIVLAALAVAIPTLSGGWSALGGALAAAAGGAAIALAGKFGFNASTIAIFEKTLK